MADNYVNADIVAGKKANPALAVGAQLLVACQTFEVAAADADGDIYRVFKDVPANAIIIKIEVKNDAITAGTDYDFGVYERNGGAVIDKDEFASAVDMSSARAVPTDISTEAQDVANIGKKLYEIVGHTIATKKASYDLAYTANTVGTAAGTITTTLYYILG